MAPRNRISAYLPAYPSVVEANVNPAAVRVRSTQNSQAAAEFSARQRQTTFRAGAPPLDQRHRIAGPIATLLGSLALTASGMAATICGAAVAYGIIPSSDTAVSIAIIGAVATLAGGLLGYGALVATAVASLELDAGERISTQES